MAKSNKKGFTITEVVIVLAVAGLIFAIVFAAIPGLKRSSRDSQRRNIALRLKTEIETYASNNEGQYPFVDVPSANPPKDCTQVDNNSDSCYDWYNHYVNGKLNISDPSSGTNVGINYGIAAPPSSPWKAGNVYIVVGAKCNGAGVTVNAGATQNSKDFALAIMLENSGSWTCIDNT